jgi:hypothetical protein
MIFVKSTLAGVAAVITAALIIYALAVGVPGLLELIPPREGGMFMYSVGPFSVWLLVVPAFFIFCGGFYWCFRRTVARSFDSRRSRNG